MTTELMYGYTAYFDRNPRKIEGYFTIQDTDGNKIFDRLPAASGQRGYTNTDWVRGKSPIPFGKYRLWLQPIGEGTEPGRSGVGEFYNISTGDDKRLIFETLTDGRSVYPKRVRQDIGLHADNSFPGSAGCIVLSIDSHPRREEVQRLWSFLKEEGKYEKYMRLIVL